MGMHGASSSLGGQLQEGKCGHGRYQRQGSDVHLELEIAGSIICEHAQAFNTHLSYSSFNVINSMIGKIHLIPYSSADSH